MAPAPNRNGSMGTGGGSRAGIAIAPKPQRSNLLYTLSKVLDGNLRARVSFPLCAPACTSQSPLPQNQPSPSRRSKATAVLSVRTRRSSARPCFQATDDGVVEKSQGNKTHATELVDPVLDAARYRGRRACNSLVNEHFRTGPTSILACETRKMAVLRGRPLRFAVLFGWLHFDW